MRRGKNESLLLLASLCLFSCEARTTAINGATLAEISIPPAGGQPSPTPSSSPSPAPSPSPSPTPPYVPGPVDVIVGYGGTVGYSLDKGKTYQVSNYGETSDDCWLWRDMAYGNGVWVAVSYTGGFGAIITSPDGVHWRHYEGKGAESIGFGNGLFVADSFTSTDGYNFNFRTINASVGGHAAIAYVDKNYVISGDQNGIAYGTDGTNFTTALPNYNGTQYNSGIDSFAVNGTDIVGVGTQRLAFSTNSGETWTNYELSTQTFAPFDTNSALRSVIYDGSQFVIYGGDGNYSATTTIWKSTDGTTWSASAGNTPSFVGGSLLTGFFGLNNGAPNVVSNWMYSADGLTWSASTAWTESPASENYYIQARVGGIAYSDPSTTPTLPASIEYTDQQLTAVGCGIPPGR